MVLEVSLLDMVLTTLGVLVAMAALSCMCCLCMKVSDYRLKTYIIEMAKTKGVTVDIDKLDTKHPHYSHANENCTIMVPDEPWSQKTAKRIKAKCIRKRSFNSQCVVFASPCLLAMLMYYG